MKLIISSLVVLLIVSASSTHSKTQFIKYKKYLIPISAETTLRPADSAVKPRVIITTDLGSTGDPDDYQTLIHALLNADKFELIGIVGSRPTGNASDIQSVISAYANDFNRTSNSLNAPSFPNPSSIAVKQGATSNPTSITPDTNISAGAQFIIDTALADTSKPLYVLGWGSLTDVAQAIHENDSIVPYLRLVSIGSTNSGYRTCCTYFDPYSRDYLYNNYTANADPDQNLWWVEGETSFRGMWGADGAGATAYENSVVAHVTQKGCLGKVWDENPIDHSFNSNGELIRPFSGDYPTTLFIMNSASQRNDPSIATYAGRYHNSTQRPFYWTEINENVLGNQCGEENSARGRGGNSCWGAGLLNQNIQNIGSDFIAASNRLETTRSYCD